jgi:hypothetical protein
LVKLEKPAQTRMQTTLPPKRYNRKTELIGKVFIYNEAYAHSTIAVLFALPRQINYRPSLLHVTDSI